MHIIVDGVERVQRIQTCRKMLSMRALSSKPTSRASSLCLALYCLPPSTVQKTNVIGPAGLAPNSHKESYGVRGILEDPAQKNSQWRS